MPLPRVIFAATAVTFALLSAERPARADAPPPASAAPAPPPPGAPATLAPAQRGLEEEDEEHGGGRRWYGWQTLITDGAALGLVLGALAAESNTAAVASLFSYLLGAPIVHWAHGRAGTGFASLGMRIGAPLVGALAGYALARASSGESPSEFSGLAFGAIGLAVGLLAPIVIDPAVLAFDRKPRSNASWIDRARLRVIGGSRGDGVVLGLGGSL